MLPPMAMQHRALRRSQGYVGWLSAGFSQRSPIRCSPNSGSRMPYIAGWKARFCPQVYSSKDPGAKAHEVRERALWSALHHLAVVRSDLMVELRYSCLEETRAVAVELLIGGDRTTQERNASEVVQVIERLLPHGYGWERIEVAERQIEGATAHRSDSWWVSSIVRRPQFVGLPSYLPPDDRPRGEQRIVQNVEGERTVGRRVFRTTTARDDETVYLAYEAAQYRAERTSYRFSLPTVADFHGVTEHRALFAELQDCAPAVVSLSLRRLGREELNGDRQVAARIRSVLSTVARSSARDVRDNLLGTLSTYTRYFAAYTQLTQLTIRAAARSRADVLSAAHAAAAPWGAEAFEVYWPGEPCDAPEAELTRLRHAPTLNGTIPAEAEDWLSGMLRRNNLALPEHDDHRYGNFLVRLPHIYTVEEVLRMLRLPFSGEGGLPGMEARMVAPFYSSSQQYRPIQDANGRPAPLTNAEIRLGRKLLGSSRRDSSDQGAEHHWHTMPVQDLTKHAFVVGSTGSGKTLYTLFLARELVRLGLPFLVIEPVKTEYYDRLRPHVPDLQRLRLEPGKGGDLGEFLAFDPMRLQRGVSVARHASHLKSCFEAAFAMAPWLALIMESGIRQYYQDPEDVGGCELDLFEVGGPATHRLRGDKVYPSLATFAEYFCGHGRADASSFIDGAFGSGTAQAEEYKTMFRRRFDNLLSGVIGRASRIADACYRVYPDSLYESFGPKLDGRTIVELDGVPDPEQKSLIMAFLTTFLFERRQAEDAAVRRSGAEPSDTLKHVLILEEAHRLLSRAGSGRSGEYAGGDARSQAVSLFVDMLAEIRALGQGIIIVEQIPTKIIPDAVKNTSLKVMLRLTSKDDREYLGEAMSLSQAQKRFVTSLRAKSGEEVQFVVFDEASSEPTALSLPLPARSEAPEVQERKAWLFDEYFVAGRPDGAGGTGRFTVHND